MGEGPRPALREHLPGVHWGSGTGGLGQDAWVWNRVSYKWRGVFLAGSQFCHQHRCSLAPCPVPPPGTPIITQARPAEPSPTLLLSCCPEHPRGSAVCPSRLLTSSHSLPATPRGLASVRLWPGLLPALAEQPHVSRVRPLSPPRLPLSCDGPAGGPHDLTARGTCSRGYRPVCVPSGKGRLLPGLPIPTVLGVLGISLPGNRHLLTVFHHTLRPPVGVRALWSVHGATIPAPALRGADGTRFSARPSCPHTLPVWAQT